MLLHAMLYASFMRYQSHDIATRKARVQSGWCGRSNCQRIHEGHGSLAELEEIGFESGELSAGTATGEGAVADSPMEA